VIAKSKPAFIALMLLLLQCTPLVAFPQDHYFESGGVPIRFIDTGEGTPVVLVHG
jgi:hypothetical protein